MRADSPSVPIEPEDKENRHMQKIDIAALKEAYERPATIDE